MQESYIKQSLAEVEKYLDEVNNKNQLNDEFEKYYSEKQQNMKNDVIKTDWYNKLSQKVEDILDGSELYNYSIEGIVERVFYLGMYNDFEVGYKGSFSIQFPAILTQLCKIYKVEIKDEICNKLGSNLDQKFTMLASAILDGGKLTFEQHQKMNDEWTNQEKVASALAKACQELLTELRQKIAEEHEGKFDFLKSSPKKPKEWKWDDDAVYNLVFELDEFKSHSKKMFLDKFKKEKNIGDFNAKIKCPLISFFDLLKDEDLKTHIGNYRQKPLEERKNDPLRMIFRWNQNTQNYNLDNITKNKTIQEWFKSFMKGTSEEDRQDIYFVLLELFGKDFEFGGGYGGTIPKTKLWDKVDEKEVKNWYKKNKIQTDLFKDLEIEKTYLMKAEDKEKNNLNTSNITDLGYKIGLFLDILITALLVYLAIKISLLFLISLVITLPIGIFCVIKLCGCCLNSHDNKIKSPYENGSGFLLGKTHELETELDQSQSKVNKSEKPKEKPVKIVTKSYE